MNLIMFVHQKWGVCLRDVYLGCAAILWLISDAQTTRGVQITAATEIMCEFMCVCVPRRTLAHTHMKHVNHHLREIIKNDARTGNKHTYTNTERCHRDCGTFNLIISLCERVARLESRLCNLIISEDERIATTSSEHARRDHHAFPTRARFSRKYCRCASPPQS